MKGDAVNADIDRKSARRLVLGAVLFVCAWSAARAQPVELRQGATAGAGTAFRRGDVCMVLTAGHVARDDGTEIVVLDRTGGRASGQVSYSNPQYDIALVTLQPGFAVACNQRWPDTSWMASANWNSRTQLDAVRHYPNGRESIIGLRWAGGTESTLSLARVDRMEIRESDSGSLVRLGDRPAGIVKLVDTAIDRVEVVRFDVIDRLVGERFRGAAGNAPVAFDGVMWRGQRHPNWTTYVMAWLTDKARRPVVPASDPQARCSIRAQVIDWGQSHVENPKYAELQASLQGCKTNILFRKSNSAIKFCEDSLRQSLSTTPRSLRRHSIQLNVEAQPRSGGIQSKLRALEFSEPAEAGRSRPDVELEVMQAAFATVAKDVLATGVCE